MGYYTNPPQLVPEQGRMLPVQDSFKKMFAQLHTGEVLVAHGDRGIFQFAGLIFDEIEFQNFYSQHVSASLLFLHWYALPVECWNGPLPQNDSYLKKGHDPESVLDQEVNVVESTPDQKVEATLAKKEPTSWEEFFAQYGITALHLDVGPGADPAKQACQVAEISRTVQQAITTQMLKKEENEHDTASEAEEATRYSEL